MSQFIILHGNTVEKQKINVVIDAIKRTGAKLIDDSNDVYLFDGESLKAKEIIDPFIGEWSITGLKAVEEIDKTKEPVCKECGNYLYSGAEQCIMLCEECCPK